MRELSVWCKAFVGLVAFSLAGTLLVKVSGLSPGWIAPATAAVTLLVGCVAILVPMVADTPSPRIASRLTVILLFGAMAELCGLYTGLPFGPYEYTREWWPYVVLPGGRVYPLLVPFAWFLVAGGSYFVGCLVLPKRAVWAGAALAALIDLAMEPVLVDRLAYWRWSPPGPLPGGASWLNPLGWLATGLVTGSILERSGTSACRRLDAAVVLAAYCALILGLGLI